MEILRSNMCFPEETFNLLEIQSELLESLDIKKKKKVYNINDSMKCSSIILGVATQHAISYFGDQGLNLCNGRRVAVNTGQPLTP